MLDRLIDLLVGSLRMFQFWVVVDEYERAIVLRLGKFRRVLEPGFHWVIPFHIDRVIHDNVVPRTVDLGPQSLTTSDGKLVVVSAIVTARIDDVQKATLNVESVSHALRDSCVAEVAGVVSSRTWEQLLEADALEADLRKACQKRATKWGIEIIRAQFSSMTPCRSIRLLQDHATPETSIGVFPSG
jgi:regulator of protease activity HflC (stomatin/prohibitin superfamily)